MKAGKGIRMEAAVLLFTAALAPAASVDLGTWTAESYPAVSGFGAGVWNVAPGGTSVTQTVNGQPTLFYSDFNARGSDVRGTITPGYDWDDDYIGFALGFQPGDSTSGSADYLLVDWKQGTQYFDFGAPSSTPGSTAYAGLAVSHVTGIPTADEFWGHVDFAGDTSGSVVELARATNLGSTGYSYNVPYEFRFVFDNTGLDVYVDGVLELSVNGTFPDGRLAFYNFSQENVTYSAFTREVLPPPGTIPAPAALPMVMLGVLGLVIGRRRLRG